MTALALTTSQTPGSAKPVDFARYVAIDEASRLLQVSDRHLRRLCQTTLERQQQAIFAQPPEGGKACWRILRSYDSRLAPGAAGAVQQMPDLVKYSEGQRDQAMRRMACVMALREARASWRGTQQQWLPQLVEALAKKYPDLCVSQSTLLRWYALFQTPCDLEKLIDRRGGNTRGAADPAAWSYFREIYLDKRGPSKESCWRRTRDAARDKGWRWISLSALKRSLDEHVSPELAAKHRDPEVWQNSFSPFIQQDPEMFEAGQCWIGDHVTLDLWCRYQGRIIRPSLTSWFDRRTSKHCGYKLCETPHSSSILCAFVMGIRDESNFGGPSIVWIDNGKDFASYTFHGSTKQGRLKQRVAKINAALDETTGGGLFHLIGVEPHFSREYTPRGKAKLERWHNTLHDQFDKSFVTYCGRSTDARPDDLQEILENKKHLIPSFEHVEARMAEFIAGYNANAEHSREDLDGLSPNEAMAAWCKTRRVLADPAALELFAAQWHKPVAVGRNGMTVAIAGKNLSYGQYNPALRQYIKTGVKLHVSYDPYDITQIRVYDQKWSFITVAEMNGMSTTYSNDPVTRDHVSQLVKDQNRHKRALGQVRTTRHVEYMSDAELLTQKAAPPKQQPPSEGSLKIVQTPLDGQSNKAVQRKAVGHYSDSDQMPRLARVSDLTESIELEQPHHNDVISLADFSFSQPSSAEDTNEQDAPTPSRGWADLTGESHE